MKIQERWIISLILAALLTGCGGGSSSHDDGQRDTTPLTVTGITPPDGATDIAISTTVSANFSRAVKCSAITLANVVLAADAGAVAGTIACSGSSATFTPARPLDYSTRYTLTVSADVRDSDDRGMDYAFSSGFMTAAVPPPASYSIAGAVNGLTSGKTVTLRNNGGNDVTVVDNGGFAFSKPVASGGAYNVTIEIQPERQTCTVTNGSGVVAAAIVGDITVTCITNSYPVGGAVTGLGDGWNVVLQNNGADDLMIPGNGRFSFSKPVDSGTDYHIAVRTQPEGQTCTVSNAAGTVDAVGISDITVSCVTHTYTIGGAVSGLGVGKQALLRNNGTDELVIAADGSFDFSRLISYGDTFDATVLTQPAGQSCTVNNGSGIGKGLNFHLTAISVVCVDIPLPRSQANSGSVTLSWGATNAARYNLYYSTAPGCDPHNYASCLGGMMKTGVSSPYLLTGLSNGQPYWFRVEAVVSGGSAISAEIGARPDRLVTNKDVRAIVADANGMTYLGGNFTHIGVRSGGGVPIDAMNGDIGAFPLVNGTVNAVAADGSGGWYIGGTFTAAGGVVRNNLAHVLANGALDMSWNPNANGVVFALAVSGNTVYAGGAFTTIGGVARSNIAALDSAGLATPWAPNANAAVYALAVSGATVYAGGAFTSIGGAAYAGLAALDNAGAPIWGPTISGGNINTTPAVYALAVSANIVYAGGNFTSVDVVGRSRLAAFDITAGTLLGWNPGADNTVSALAVAAGRVYAGGYFANAGGSPRNHLAAFNAGTGALDTGWDPNAVGIIGSNPAVNALAISGGTVYVGGNFTTLQNVERNYLAAVDAGSGALTTWYPNANAAVYALAVAGNTLYAGGGFTAVRGVTRNRLAALNSNHGIVTAWDPNAGSTVHALALSNGRVYAGGAFTFMSGAPYNRLAAIDAVSGAPDAAWNPDANGTVFALTALGGRVYAGGMFTSVSGVPRSYLAAVDTATGTLDSAWSPSASNHVYTLAASGATVYAGGNFTTINGDPSYQRLVALDAFNGAPTPGWGIYGANAAVNTLVISGSTVYAGGVFTNIGGLTRQYLAALDLARGNTITTWSPVANGAVNALAVSGGAVYAGGAFTAIGGVTRSHLAAVDAAGALTSWDPDANNTVNALAVVGNAVYAGGLFTAVGGEPVPGLALLPP
ncbi:MAG: Ig-like domain-containing protein [Gammaproteobacteria bacterium]|nr:Ig-like domain-containing protein [Gammaproteobacteria bacterium]